MAWFLNFYKCDRCEQLDRPMVLHVRRRMPALRRAGYVAVQTAKT